MYQVEKLKIKRVGETRLELDIKGEKQVIETEDLATIVREELPNDRAAELFAEIEERAIKKGKVRVVVKAHKHIKKGEDVCFTLDISKYVGDSHGIRTTPSGLIF